MIQVRIGTYNIHRCFGMDRKYDPSRIGQVIQELEVDLIGLQEVDASLKSADPGDERNQLEFLSDQLGMQAVMGSTVTRPYGFYGNAFLSRYPLENVVEASLSYRASEPRGMIAADLVLPSGRVRVVNTHLGLGWSERRYQVKKLTEEIERAHGLTTVLLGDFNEWYPYSRNLKHLALAFSPHCAVPSFPSSWPRLCLDRIWVHPVADGESIELRSVLTPLTRRASDHLPVLASIRLQ